jgi:hypothetical protein
MKEATNKLANPISLLNFGSKDMPIEEFDTKYIMAELVDLARGRGIHLGLVWIKRPIGRNDGDDLPTPIVKFPQPRGYAQLLSNFAVEHPLEFSLVDVMNMRSFIPKLNKLLISNINKHHQKTIYSYFS